MGRRSLPTDEFNLTERERKVLDFMKKTAAEKGYPPTVREICQELNVKSTSTIHKDLASLEKKASYERIRQNRERSRSSASTVIRKIQTVRLPVPRRLPLPIPGMIRVSPISANVPTS